MEMVLIDDMVHPYGCRADAMLGHVASWGDRCPHMKDESLPHSCCQAEAPFSILRDDVSERPHRSTDRVCVEYPFPGLGN